jgi:hypothetical protein
LPLVEEHAGRFRWLADLGEGDGCAGSGRGGALVQGERRAEGGWRVEGGGRRVEGGEWRVEGGRRRKEGGRWRVESAAGI